MLKLRAAWAAVFRYADRGRHVPYSVRAATVVTVAWAIAAVMAGIALLLSLVPEPNPLPAVYNFVVLTLDLAGLRFGLRKLAEARERRRFARVIVEGFITREAGDG